MATVTLDRPGSATNLRAVFSSGALYLPSAGGTLETNSGTPVDYQVSSAASIALENNVNRHAFTVPVPTIKPVTLDFVILDVSAHSVVGSGEIHLE
jgi:hypothetical protein